MILSERLSIALCTNPPSPLVGDWGRSKRSGEIRPCDGDIASVRATDEDSSPREELVSEGGGWNLWLLKVGNGDRTPPSDEFDAELENLFIPLVSPCNDPSSEGDKERPLSLGGLNFSDSRLVFLDRPGNCLLAPEELVSDILSSLFLRYAAEPDPRSSVCLNQSGSFDSSDFAIWFLDVMVAFAVLELAFTRRDSIAPSSVVIMDNGRPRAPVNSRDEGRCCQERVPARFGIVVTRAESLELSAGFEGCCAMFRGDPA